MPGEDVNKNTHIYLYRLTGGIIGGKMGSRPLLLLTTTGRKSGKERVTPLLYLTEGTDYLLSASNSGSEQHPQWYRNLLAHPQATVQIGRKVIPVTARTASAEDRPRLWARFTQYGNFAGYERKTTREIPVVILTPNSAG
jgi:deazaflavin-dependent oxidoreductase (nitroreductase family)